MWPILGCSVIALAIILERIVVLIRCGKDPSGYLRRLIWALWQGRWIEASSLADHAATPLEKIIAAGYREFLEQTDGNWQFGESNPSEQNVLSCVEMAMEAHAKTEVEKMRQNFPLLDVIITVSPMLGLLGTVTGIIKCFDVINSLAGATDPLRLSVGIAEALITTAGGLIVAIPAVLCSTYLNILVEKNVGLINRWGDEFLRLLRAKRGEELEYSGAKKTAAARDN